MFRGKIKTIKDGLSIMKWGADLRSKKILLLTDLLSHLGHKRKMLRKRIAHQISKSAASNEVILSFKISRHDSFPVKYRLNDYSDYQSLSECFGNMYEVPESNIEFLMDAGANIGFFSISMMNRFNIKEGIAVEPNPHNLELLGFNLSRFNNISLRPVALSKDNGELVFELDTSNTGHLKGAIGHAPTDKTVLVKSVALSSIIPPHWKMDKTLLKIDIEGAEYDVLPELFNEHYYPKIITGEIHDYFNGGENLVSMMKSLGYKIHVNGSGKSGNVCRQITAVRNSDCSI